MKFIVPSSGYLSTSVPFTKPLSASLPTVLHGASISTSMPMQLSSFGFLSNAMNPAIPTSLPRALLTEGKRGVRLFANRPSLDAFAQREAIENRILSASQRSRSLDAAPEMPARIQPTESELALESARAYLEGTPTKNARKARPQPTASEIALARANEYLGISPQPSLVDDGPVTSRPPRGSLRAHLEARVKMHEDQISVTSDQTQNAPTKSEVALASAYVYLGCPPMNPLYPKEDGAQDSFQSLRAFLEDRKARRADSKADAGENEAPASPSLARIGHVDRLDVPFEVMESFGRREARPDRSWANPLLMGELTFPRIESTDRPDAPYPAWADPVGTREQIATLEEIAEILPTASDETIVAIGRILSRNDIRLAAATLAHDEARMKHAQQMMMDGYRSVSPLRAKVEE